MLSNSTINDRTVEEYVTLCFEVTQWLDKFNKSGQEIFGEDYESVLALIGIASLGMSRSINDLVDNAEKYAKGVNDRRNKNLFRGFGIKLEDDDTPKS